ncbi:hypothetical protein [Paracoccus sp. MC1862]|uniref:hypothetical protein n=1 Tax=Paracoccus sp. MC1862 TaxID=2760307 RepID=UPI001F41740C|nr:hypothetical protein [Paracoccus sp. MC1862]
MRRRFPRIQPWVARIGNIALYLTIGTTILGNLPEVMGMVGEGAMLMGLVFIAAMFGIGYLAGGRSDRDDLEDVSALGSGWRNTAATMIIAVQNFGAAPEVLAIITMVNTLGIILLPALARVLSRDAPGFTTTPGRPKPGR